MSGMFFGCSKLVSLNLLNFKIEKDQNIKSMFSYCVELQQIVINKNINYLPIKNSLKKDNINAEIILE